MKNKGFTLIELLVVIVILAIIALITVPNALAMIATAQERANARSEDGILRAAELYCMTEKLKGTAPIIAVSMNNLVPNFIKAVPDHLDGQDHIEFNQDTCAPNFVIPE